MTKIKEFLLMEASEKKKLKDGAISVAEAAEDEMVYRIKDYFSGWPEDVIGKEMSDFFYKTMYQHLEKLIKERLKRYK